MPRVPRIAAETAVCEQPGEAALQNRGDTGHPHHPPQQPSAPTPEEHQVRP